MRVARASVLACIVFLAASSEAQQIQLTQTQTLPTQTPAPQDAQAVSVLTQALTAAGGTPAIQAISDFTATGNVTYHWNPDEQGNVTIQGLGVSEIRIDSSLPSGQHSESIHNGQTARKEPNGTLWQYPPPYPIPGSDAVPYQPPMFPGSFVIPLSQVAAILNNPRCSISYKGIVQVDSTSVHDIQVQRILPGQTIPDGMAEYHTIEIFVDTTTLQISMTQNSIPNHIVHRIHYSDYRAVSGVLVPYSISEEMGGQKTRDIQLSQVSFNGGIQDSAFEIIQ